MLTHTLDVQHAIANAPTLSVDARARISTTTLVATAHLPSLPTAKARSVHTLIFAPCDVHEGVGALVRFAHKRGLEGSLQVRVLDPIGQVAALLVRATGQDQENPPHHRVCIR